MRARRGVSRLVKEPPEMTSSDKLINLVFEVPTFFCIMIVVLVEATALGLVPLLQKVFHRHQFLYESFLPYLWKDFHSYHVKGDQS